MVEVDPLCIYGTIQNLCKISEDAAKRYNISQGWMFDVEDYQVIFAGRHQI